jgi:hypothetical protein
LLRSQDVARIEFRREQRSGSGVYIVRGQGAGLVELEDAEVSENGSVEVIQEGATCLSPDTAPSSITSSQSVWQ